MPILVEYACRDCGARSEHWTPTPAPSSLPCAECHGPSRRLFGAVGLAGRAAAGRQEAPPPAPRPGRSMCSQYPQVPGLCHMSESAGRMWVAKYLKDGRSIDREQERQERRAAVKAPTMADAITHQHHEPTAEVSATERPLSSPASGA